MKTERLRPVIDAMAAWVGLPPWAYRDQDPFAPGEWLEGLILQESGGEPRAVRYEGHQDFVSDGDSPGVDDGMTEDDKSYGLMQVMGYNARVLCGVPKGVRMDFSFLLLPLTNLTFGLRVLNGDLIDSNGDVATALARYNGGGSGNPVGGPLRNQSYVDGVARWSTLAQIARGARMGEP